MSRHKRYSQYMPGASGNQCPRCWSVLAVDSSVMPGSDVLGRPELELRQWALVYLQPVNSCDKRQVECRGQTASGLWATLEAYLRRRGTLVCLCADAIQALSILRAWERISRGDASLCKAPLILSDPPTAVRLSLRGLRGKLLLLDSRNYGLSIPPGTDGLHRLTTVAQHLPDMLAYLQLGSLQPTAGGQAMYGYRRSFLSTPLYLHCRPDVLQLEKDSLHGGRAECYRLGRVDGPIYELDFTGFYGSIMRDISVPTVLRYHGEAWKPHGLREFEAGYGVIARVKVRTEWPYLPCLRDGLTVFPVGEWYTVLAGEELVQAYLSGDVVEVGQWSSYETDTALQLYARKLLSCCYGPHRYKSADLRAIVKALLVSLIGKFAQRSLRWEDRPDAKAEHDWSKWLYVDTERSAHLYRSVAGRVQRQIGNGFGPFACPAIAAWIYAEGRYRLWQAQLVAGRGEVYYCHTDSLFVSELGFNRLCEGRLVGDSVPGKLTLKAKHGWMDIHGLSHYHLPTRTVCAGVVGSAGGKGEDGTGPYYGDTVGTALAESRPPLPILYRSAAEHMQPYRHGIRGEDGRVTPWRIGPNG